VNKSPFKILVTGVESTGKSELVKFLADSLNLPFTREFARKYLEGLNRDYSREDLDAILIGQLDLENKALNLASAESCEAVICDTGPEVLYIWSEHKFGKVSVLIQRALIEFDYDLVLLTDVDLEWTPDIQRETPGLEERQVLLNKYKTLLQRVGVSYCIISGHGASRFALAKKRVEEFLNKKSPQQS